MTERIGIVGGTFDPVHFGHLAIGEEARVALHLDRVLFIPAAQQPLKRHAPLAAANHRLAMLQLACVNHASFEVLPIELERPGLSFTVTTLETLTQIYDAKFFLILGADALSGLAAWQQAERVVELAQIVGVGRKGSTWEHHDLYRALPALETRLTLLEGPGLDLASSALRRRVAAGLPLRYLVPDLVAEYISVHRLYLSHDDE